MKKYVWGDVVVMVTDSQDGDMKDSELAERVVSRWKGGKLVMPKQAHTNVVVDVGQTGGGRADGVVLERGDERMVGVLTADCVPVVMWGENKLVVVHAGRRGLLAGVMENGLKKFNKAPVKGAFIGPSIGPCCYQVELAEDDRLKAGRFYVAGKLDLRGWVREILEKGGVEWVEDEEVCTRCGGGYWSYRGGDGGKRFLTVAGWS